MQLKKLRPLLLVLTVSTGFAQTRTLQGRVTENNGQPLFGVTIIAQPSGNTAQTKEDGTFILNTVTKDTQLQLTSIGYEQAIFLLTNATDYTFQLHPSLTDLDEVILVGTRSSGRTRLTSAVPVDVFNMTQLQIHSPQTDMNQLLQFASPSFNSNRQSSSDGTEHIDPASIRGLGPDQLLVMINGKRRHTTSLVNNQRTIGNGSVGTDLNAIPVSAISRIEILRDGASAQYGSDAIAGVVNIVLKKNTNELFVSTTGGVSSRNDGGLGQLNLNYGSDLGKNGGGINLTAEATYRDKTTRTQNHNLIIFDQSALGNFLAYDFTDDPAASRQYDDNQLATLGLNRKDFDFQIGDARIKNINTFMNLALPFGNNKGNFYAFGGYSFRKGEGFGFRRLPSETKNNVPSIFPLGYQPITTSHIHDRSIAVGATYELGKWHADLSNTLGNNRFDYIINNTVNASLKEKSPTHFKAGGHEFLQNTTNIDFSRYFSTFASGLNVAFGSEFRVDNYRIRKGEEASWRNYGWEINSDGTVTDILGLPGGSQSFNGFSPTNSTNKSRNNFSLYADAELDVNEKWLIGIAGRFENYSDFGATVNGKISSRYKVTSIFNIRGAISTGFRAPSLHQQYFSSTSTDILPDGKIGQSGFFTNNSAVANALNIPKLKEETSLNYSLGFTLKPAHNFNVSVDGYLIDIKDRIVLTGSFGFNSFGNPIPKIQKILEPLGVSSARFFSNAVDTRTIGVDIVADYTAKMGLHTFQTSLGFNANKNTIVGTIHIPQDLTGQENIFFSPNDRTLIEEGTPRIKTNLLITYTYKNINATLNNVYFGQVSRNSFPYGSVQRHHGKIVTDLSLSYTINNTIFTLGSNNIFDIFMDRQIYNNSYFGVFKYAPVQMGTLGSYFFGRITVNIPTGKS